MLRINGGKWSAINGMLFLKDNCKEMPLARNCYVHKYRMGNDWLKCRRFAGGRLIVYKLNTSSVQHGGEES